MEVTDSRVMILGGSGLVGMAIAREMLRARPSRLVITALSRREVDAGLAELRSEASDDVELAGDWGNLFVAGEFKDERRPALLDSAAARGRLLDDLYGPMSRETLERSHLYDLLTRERPQIVVDCVNTATAIAYQDIFSSVKRVRSAIAAGSDVLEIVDRHLLNIYMPQLIRHIQILLEALRTADTAFYLKIGTSGTGGMGLNVPFTHSEQRPSSMLLAKAGMAGAHSLLLFLLARTPGAPAVKEIKPAAAIAWKRIGAGPIERGGEPIRRYDATEPVPLAEAFAPGARPWRELDGHLESVYLDAGENGQFSRDEFETISSLGMMEIVTPEEIATTVIREIRGQPTGLDVVSAIDATAMGPTYRGGVLRELALRRMEELERQMQRRSVAFEILGPPRLSKLLFEAHILERLFGQLRGVAEMDPDRTAEQAGSLIDEDEGLRVSMLSVGIPILTADGEGVLRGPEVKVEPDPEEGLSDRVVSRGWVDLRPSNWRTWKGRVERYLDDVANAARPDEGSIADIDVSGRMEAIRPGALAAWVLKTEDGGERVKR